MWRHGSYFESHGWVAALPERLQSLNLLFMGRDVSLEGVPRGLSSFVGPIPSSSHLSLLPDSLTDLEITAANPPLELLTGMDHFGPRNLTKLKVSFSHISSFQLLTFLPLSLTAISLYASDSDQHDAQLMRQTDLGRSLPKRLENLELTISIPSSIIPADRPHDRIALYDWLSDLRDLTSLTRLHVNTIGCIWDSLENAVEPLWLATLPRSLRHLAIPASFGLLRTYPTYLHHLPPNLEALHIGNRALNVAILGTNPSLLFSRLPPSLTSLSIPCLDPSDFPSDFLQLIPPGLIELRLPMGKDDERLSAYYSSPIWQGFGILCRA